MNYLNTFIVLHMAQVVLEWILLCFLMWYFDYQFSAMFFENI